MPLTVDLQIPVEFDSDDAQDLVKALEQYFNKDHSSAFAEGWHPVPERAALEKRWVNSLDFDWLYNQVVKLFDLPLEKALVSSPYGKWLRPSWERRIDKILKKFFGQNWDVLINESVRVGIDPRSSLAKRVLPALVEQEMSWVKIFVSSWLRKFGQDLAYGVAQDVITAGRHRYPPQRLAYDLRQRFAEKDSVPQRDWRRVAVTESNRLAETGHLATIGDMTYVLGQSYGTACAYCKKLVHGRMFLKIQPPDNPTELQLQNAIWVGKTNMGRKRADWVPCVSTHPLCRCFFITLNPENWWVDVHGRQQPRVGHEAEWQAWRKNYKLEIEHGKLLEPR
jgi:hypothetical protein